VVDEARLVEGEAGGLVPEGDGWLVLNARDAGWLDGTLGKYTGFEGPTFPAARHQPQRPPARYFLVLAGECTLIVQGESGR
jgi:hypothetical protein